MSICWSTRNGIHLLSRKKVLGSGQLWFLELQDSTVVTYKTTDDFSKLFPLLNTIARPTIFARMKLLFHFSAKYSLWGDALREETVMQAPFKMVSFCLHFDINVMLLLSSSYTDMTSFHSSQLFWSKLNLMNFAAVSADFDSRSNYERTSTLRMIWWFKLTYSPSTLTAPRNETWWNVPPAVSVLAIVLARLAGANLTSGIGETRNEKRLKPGAIKQLSFSICMKSDHGNDLVSKMEILTAARAYVAVVWIRTCLAPHPRTYKHRRPWNGRLKDKWHGIWRQNLFCLIMQ